jgi:hypothetical protein
MRGHEMLLGCGAAATDSTVRCAESYASTGGRLLDAVATSH